MKIQANRSRSVWAGCGVALALLAGFVMSPVALAGAHERSAARPSINSGGGGARSAANNGNRNVDRNNNVNRNDNVNRNTNVNRNSNVNVNRNVDVNVDADRGWDNGYHDHPVATAVGVTAAVAVTAAVVGSVVNSVPPSCATTVVNGMAYQQCGGTWYQPQYAGSNVTYVVVNPPQ